MFNGSSASALRATDSSSDDDQVAINLASDHQKKPAGRKKFRETRHPVYRGVRRRNGGKWVCEVRVPHSKSRLWLGTYPTVEMAARAHDVAAMAFKGTSACLNFADSVRLLPIPDTDDVEDIRKAAMQAAEMFRPVEEPGTARLSPGNELCSEEEKACTTGIPDRDTIMDGVLLSPPLSFHSGNCSSWDNCLEFDADVPLWSFPF